ncbi:hypothetical protein HMPREF0063_11345 [Aeromicrobium marinum DSM 15272]|uniref:G domain-containing protein n=1 Tax=Aeromicrobium marinum DSM 15272 TaxID=585531 RepID=E2SBD6_9ACTN|nr:GTPase [Aeromicrobium marinum]EFQ83682.1 hypothetical protein HMPREF0063_11345 [Aeromicrobium marinum DSM 15272]
MTEHVTPFRDQPSEVSHRLDGLSDAVEAARGRLEPSLVQPAADLAGRGTERLRLSGEHTIVALAGATGSGKSSLFNALTDLELAGVGLRRPTTSWALACAWGPDGAEGLLQWMGIPARHQVSRMSMLDGSSDDTKLDGLVLLDLPDHDSTEVSHHLEMERLVEYADVLVWVLDPQKYADAAIHDRYIRPMAGYSDVTVVVLNQIDRIPLEQRDRALADVRRILAEEGLPDVTVVGVSATRGDGIDDLKRELARRIRSKASARQRLTTDVRARASEISEVGGRSTVPGVTDTDVAELDRALVDGVGVPQIVTAISSITRRRAVRRTGWPVTRWLGRLRKEPWQELGLGEDLSPAALAKAAVPDEARVQRASAETAVRDFAEKAAVGLERPWRDAVRAASTVQGADIVAELDRAVAGTDLKAVRPAVWWTLVNVLQWLLLVAAVAGLGWWVAADVVDVGDVSAPPEVMGRSAALVLAVGAALAGIAVATAARGAGRVGAGRRAAHADRELRATIDEVARARVVEPVRAELELYDRYRRGIEQALS